MSWLFIILLMMACWHYLWECAIAPSERLKLRVELFRLRDEVRWLAHTKPHEMTDEVFEQLQESLNTSVRVLSRLDPFILLEFRRQLYHDESLAREVERRIKVIQSASEEIKSIQYKAVDIMRRAMNFNTGGWLVYVIPVVVMVLAAAVGVEIAQRLQKVILKLIALTESELGSLVPIDYTDAKAEYQIA